MQQQHKIPAGCRHVLVYVNPTAGAWSTKQAVERLTTRLTGLGCTSQVLSSPVELTKLVDKFMAAGELRAVVSAGGDGTAALVISCTAPGTPIAILPQGTENLLSRYLLSPKTPEAIASMVAAGELVRLDAGEANGRLFTLMASCGVDAEVVRQLAEVRKGHISHLSYFKPFLAAMRSYKYPPIRVYPGVAPEHTERGISPHVDAIEAKWAVVTNTPLYAMGLKFAPGARADDGLIDVTAYRNGNWHSMVRYYGSALLGLHPRRVSAVSEAGASFYIESDEPVPYQVDGDPGGHLPLEIKVLPQRLTLVVRKGVRERLPIGEPFETEHSQ
jgi:diacylglycerol kinase family enzyme